MDIKIKNISKRYSGNVDYTLENINLDIKSGEFVVLLGPSGCGKTTLLRMIAGLNSITKGELIFGDTKVNNVEPKNRNLAMVFQSYALYPHLSIYKNMAYSLKIRGYKKAFIDRRVKSVAKILEIDHLLFNKPSEISGGQKQRVALGRAIVRKPAIFLMDEPLSNLDAKLRELMRVELVKIHKLVGSTTIYVTHDQLEAMTMADKIVLFNNRTIQQVGSPQELYNMPANLFVAKFIGSPSMNFLDIEKQNDLWFVEGTNIKIHVPFKYQKKLQHYHRFILGARPEHVLVSSKKHADKSMEVNVVVNEMIGKESIITASYGFKKDIQFVVPQNNIYKSNDKVFVTFDESQFHFFNKTTQERIN